MDETPDWLLNCAKEMVMGLRHMQDKGIMPPQYGTSIPDTMSALIKRLDPSWAERSRERQ
jgi:hypothetical protein